MKTFNDLEFQVLEGLHKGGIAARITFENGFGASVVRHDYSYGGKDGLYELAVVGKNGEITYDTPVTNDVEGYLNEEDVTILLEQIQKL